MDKAVGIFNDVLGPVMRGPSSSHTAGAYHIARLARSLLGGEPASAEIVFEPSGSYVECYRPQGADRAFAAGLMGWDITDERFLSALRIAAKDGRDIRFGAEPLEGADHPNAVELRLATASGERLTLRAKSVGGGVVEVTRVDDWNVRLTGETHHALAEADAAEAGETATALASDGCALGEPTVVRRGGKALVHARRSAPLPDAIRPGLRGRLREASPVFFVQRGEPLFRSAAEMVALAEERGASLGEIALAYEARLLGLSEVDILAEARRRCEVMRASVRRGLGADMPPMRLLRPTASRIYQADAEGRLPTGGMHTRAAARSMAVMHVNAGMGLVCAAPTAGSAGVLPGVLVTLEEEMGVPADRLTLAALAASAVGLIVGIRATFAAEVAGCQVEIGASGAMASAAVVESAEGSARQACDAAAISFQNTMGMVCDLVQGTVEIPCHTRNAVAASSAFVVADLVLGGYENPVPLDETVDVVYKVGRMMPSELRCTSKGGIATAPSALALGRQGPVSP